MIREKLTKSPWLALGLAGALALGACGEAQGQTGSAEGLSSYVPQVEGSPAQRGEPSFKPANFRAEVFSVTHIDGKFTLAGCLVVGETVAVFGTDFIEGRVKGGRTFAPGSVERGILPDGTEPEGHEPTPEDVQAIVVSHNGQLQGGKHTVGERLIDCDPALPVVPTLPVHDRAHHYTALGNVPDGAIVAYSGAETFTVLTNLVPASPSPQQS
jgi:hypothetical protein